MDTDSQKLQELVKRDVSAEMNYSIQSRDHPSLASERDEDINPDRQMR